MKYIFTTLLAFMCLSAQAGKKTFDKLTEVNKCWLEQKDVALASLPDYSTQSEKDWIRTHLSLVENTLRARSTAHLSPLQRENRMKALDHLNQYWHAGNFPINDLYSYRTPIFIDRHNNFCAVGYLVKATGFEHVSRMIAAKTNLAYVRQMNYRELFAWANDYGFTEDELAWIQPSYPPVRHTAKVGKGTNGEIFELYADNAGGKLYVGGSFTMADSSVTANGIAYVTESNGNYTWHNLGSGVNGTVYAIAAFDNKIFVGGSFTQAGSTPVNNVAYWDGSAWHDAGVAGKVNDLVVYNNELYAAGQFDIMGGLIDVNFAKWNGTSWVPYSGLIGHINTMEVVGNDLLLGGNFSYGIMAKNIIKWNATNSFQPFGSSLENEVNDIEKFGDTVYAVCSRTAVNDSALINKLRNNMWEDAAPGLISVQIPSAAEMYFKTLCAQADTFMVGGQFFVAPTMMNYAQNTYSFINPTNVANWINVDSAVNKMVVFKGELIAAGKFQYGNYGFGWGNVRLNNITRKSYASPMSVGNVGSDAGRITLYPNPASASASVVLENRFDAKQVLIMDIHGKTVASYRISDKKTTLALPQLASGSYVVEAFNANGEKTTQKLIIK